SAPLFPYATLFRACSCGTAWVKLPALAAKPLTACSLAAICSALAASGVQVSVTVRIGPATPAVSPKLALSCWIAPSISALVWRNAANAPASKATASRLWLARRCEFTCRLEAAVLAPPSRAAFHPAYPVLAPKTTSVVTSAAIQKLLPRPRPLPAIVSTTVLMVLPLPCFVRSRPSGRRLSEFRRARQPGQAEHAPRVVGEPVGPLDEMRVAAPRERCGVHLLALLEAALAEQLVDGDRDVAVGLAHDQHPLGLVQHGALAPEERLGVHDRQQVAAHVAHAEHPRLRPRHRRDRRQRQDLHHFVERRREAVVADAIAHAAPQARRVELLGYAGNVREAALLVVEQHRERVAHRVHPAASSSRSISPSRTSSFGGLTR